MKKSVSVTVSDVPSNNYENFQFLVSQKLLKFKFAPADALRYGEIFTTNSPSLTYDEYLYKVDTGSPTAFESGDEQ